MTVQDIKALPKEFDFKSNINTMGLTYHAVKKENCYIVTTDDCEWVFSKHDMHKGLLNGDYVVAGNKMFYKVFFTIDTGCRYDDHIAIVSADNGSEAINKVSKYVESKLTYDEWIKTNAK